MRQAIVVLELTVLILKSKTWLCALAATYSDSAQSVGCPVTIIIITVHQQCQMNSMCICSFICMENHTYETNLVDAQMCHN